MSGSIGKMDIHAFLDDGSTVTLIDRAIAEYVGARGTRGTIRINCVGGLTKDSKVN